MKTQTISVGTQKYTLYSRDDTDDSVIYEVFKSQEYSRTKEILQKATHGVIDIGAHIGTFVLYARAHNATVPIFAYEPLEENYTLLKRHIKENHLSHVVSSQVAVGGHAGESVLQVSQNNHNNSLGTPLDDKVLREQKVQTVVLDRIFSKNRLEVCDLLKVDCEGAEYDIFTHTSPETFAKIRAIMMEYHEHQGHSYTELVSLLTKHGFVLRHHEASKYHKGLGTLFFTRTV